MVRTGGRGGSEGRDNSVRCMMYGSTCRWSVETLSIKPTPTLLWGRTTCYAVGLCIYLCQCQARALTNIDYVCLLYQPEQGIDAFRSPETITLCLSNEWVVPAGQNKAFFNVLVVTFLFFAVLFTGLTYM